MQKNKQKSDTLTKVLSDFLTAGIRKTTLEKLGVLSLTLNFYTLEYSQKADDLITNETDLMHDKEVNKRGR